MRFYVKSHTELERAFSQKSASSVIFFLVAKRKKILRIISCVLFREEYINNFPLIKIEYIELKVKFFI